MTTVIVDTPKRRMSARGHAGDRDICIAVTWSIRTLAHCLEASNSLVGVRQDQGVPEFSLEWSAKGDAIAAEVVDLLKRFSAEHPDRLEVRFGNALRYDGERLSASA